MAPKVVSIMMASVVADHLSITDTGIKSDDRHLRRRASAFLLYRDYTLNLSNLSNNTTSRQYKLCGEHDPKEQNQVYTFNSRQNLVYTFNSEEQNQEFTFNSEEQNQVTMTKEEMWKKCIQLNLEYVQDLYYAKRNAGKYVPKLKVFMRTDESSSEVYCENVSYMVKQKLKGNRKERHATKCRNGQKWEAKVMNLNKINRENPLQLYCDKQKQRDFRSFEGKKCKQYPFESMSGLCMKGLPDFHNSSIYWLLGKKNDLGQSIVDTCCACSAREIQDPVLSDYRKNIKKRSMTVDQYLARNTPVDVGTGSESIPMWYWTGRRCERFNYTGQGGNMNRFETAEECKFVHMYLPEESFQHWGLNAAKAFYR